jgi:hypothetical protein
MGDLVQDRVTHLILGIQERERLGQRDQLLTRPARSKSTFRVVKPKPPVVQAMQADQRVGQIAGGIEIHWRVHLLVTAAVKNASVRLGSKIVNMFSPSVALFPIQSVLTSQNRPCPQRVPVILCGSRMQQLPAAHFTEAKNS